MIYNTRFPAMWKIINEHYDFKSMVHLDVGCGHCDLIKATHDKGAVVYGLDKDKSLIAKMIRDNWDRLQKKTFNLITDDVNEWTLNWYPFHTTRGVPKINVITCMSVLPYLNNPLLVLEIFSKIANTLILECQYYGDGPGLKWIKRDQDMQYFLSEWYDAQKIGETEVEGRDKMRSIWLCRLR